MTARELIAALEWLPPDTEIFIGDVGTVQPLDRERLVPGFSSRDDDDLRWFEHLDQLDDCIYEDGGPYVIAPALLFFQEQD